MDALFDGLRLVTAWPAIGLMVVGVVCGLYFGGVPGLGGMIGFTILIPFTFGMEPASAFALLLGMYAVTTTAETLSAVMLGVPGTAAAAATVVDGYPCSKRGEAMRALGAAYASSAMGGVLGAIVGAASLPILKPLVLTFGPPEFFMLGVLGLTFVGSLSGEAPFKGVLAAFVGLLFSMVGYSTQGGVARYNFGINYLLNGLDIIPVVLGFFSIPEIIELATKGSSIAESGKMEAKGQIARGVRDVIEHWWLMVRSSAIGLYIGFLPGGGAAVADWVAYGHAVQSAKDKSQFGKGDIRGVIAPQAAENATKPGGLLPTVAFGIPGSAGKAILLGAFLMHGLRPGPDLLTTNVAFTYSLMWTLAIANVLGALMLMLWSRQIAKLTFVRGAVLVPGIIIVTFMGAWMRGNDIGDWITLLVFGVIGYVMRRLKWPRPPVVLGFVLGPIMEQNLDLSHQALGWTWVGRPWVIVMVVVLLLTMLYPMWKSRRRRAKEGDSENAPRAEPKQPLRFPIGSGAFALILVATFGAAYLIARQWTIDASFFPQIVSACGGGLALIIMVGDFYRARAVPVTSHDLGGDGFAGALGIFGMLIGMVVLSLLVGQWIGMPITVALFLWFWAREKWTMVAAQTVAAAGILYLLFDRVLHPVWIDPVFPISISDLFSWT